MDTPLALDSLTPSYRLAARTTVEALLTHLRQLALRLNKPIEEIVALDIVEDLHREQHRAIQLGILTP